MIFGIIIIETDIVIIIAFLIGVGSEFHRAFPELDFSAGSPGAAVGADVGVADVGADVDVVDVASVFFDVDDPSIINLSLIMYCKIYTVKILLYKTK
jgi:hypothetical protein